MSTRSSICAAALTAALGLVGCGSTTALNPTGHGSGSGSGSATGGGHLISSTSGGQGAGSGGASTGTGGTSGTTGGSGSQTSSTGAASTSAGSTSSASGTTTGGSSTGGTTGGASQVELLPGAQHMRSAGHELELRLTPESRATMAAPGGHRMKVGVVPPDVP